MLERILLLGSGGREHALAKALKRSASCETLWCCPGNPGIWELAERVDLDFLNSSAVIQWCNQHKPTLIVIGPEQPLAAGISDALRREGFTVFGPSQAAARLESSKAFAKAFMGRHNIPTAQYREFTDRDSAREYVAVHSLPVVIKYDGLAAGKGVVVAQTTAEAIEAVDNMFDGAYGTDGVVIESFLEGVEASIFAVTDGTHYVTLAPSHDHKRVGDGNTGKNTGGMGAVAPSPRVSNETLTKVCTTIIEPTIRGMAEEGNPFVGCLYCGVMIDKEGNPSVVEFNARFGDPETQSVMQVLRADVARLFASAARGALDSASITSVCEGASACVVLASAGYPDSYAKGKMITGIQEASSLEGVDVYHAGTSIVSADMTSADRQIQNHDAHGDSSVLVTSGGRVLGVTAHASTLVEAIQRANAACALITFEGKYHRTDIGIDA